MKPFDSPSLCEDLIKHFQLFLSEGCDSICVILSTSDIAKLVPPQWLNLQIIEHFVKQLNTSRKSSVTFTLPMIKSPCREELAEK